MGRSHITPVLQPDDNTCGPVALKVALTMLGKRKSLTSLIDLCKTTRNGTSTRHMIDALNKLGFAVLIVEYATLNHLQSALKYRHNKPRAVLVSYLYDLDEWDEPYPDSGHWAAVSSYSARNSKIVLLDSASGGKKSYRWMEFRYRWMDFDLKRKRLYKQGRSFRLVKKWQNQLLMVIAKGPENLPTFRISTSKVFLPH